MRALAGERRAGAGRDTYMRFTIRARYSFEPLEGVDAVVVVDSGDGGGFAETGTSGNVGDGTPGGWDGVAL